MKKLDLHIHTISTVSDYPFSFSIESLTKYVEEEGIDAIAITNHNCFDRNQFEQIRAALAIKVFPGIEVDIEKGHLLVITDDNDLDEFELKCAKIHEMNGNSSNSYVTENSFVGTFPQLDKYLLIPHYDKYPALNLQIVPVLKKYITCGEVTSPKKFISMKKDPQKPVPVLFGDIRASDVIAEPTNRQTYVDVEELSLSAIKLSLMDKAKVSLSPDDGHTLFEILENGLKISTGLTVILGKRSSGKTYTLERINEQFENAKYIRQFSLLTTDDAADQQRFEQLLHIQSATVEETYLAQFKAVVDDVAEINLKNDEQDLERYIRALLQAASEAERKDIYAKCTLFHETLYNEKDLSILDSLIEAVDLLIRNTEYRDIINRYIERNALLNLAISLRNRYIQEREADLKARYVNSIIQSVQRELQVRSSNTPIPDIDFFQILSRKEKIKRFEMITHFLKKERIIEERSLYSYRIIAKAAPFLGAQGMQRVSKSHMVFSDAFASYDRPYEFLQILKQKEGLPASDYYKFFVKISYEVLNQHNTPASGGERSEYNLLQSLDAAARSEILILDEPESSFDNLFLKDGVNTLLKELSQQIPVIIATHNNTIGASVHPDYIIYTQKEILEDGSVKYQLFSGYPSSSVLTDLEGKTVSRRSVMLDCLEAGEPAYKERRRSYEISDN